MARLSCALKTFVLIPGACGAPRIRETGAFWLRLPGFVLLGMHTCETGSCHLPSSFSDKGSSIILSKMSMCSFSRIHVICGAILQKSTRPVDATATLPAALR